VPLLIVTLKGRGFQPHRNSRTNVARSREAAEFISPARKCREEAKNRTESRRDGTYGNAFAELEAISIRKFFGGMI
jgi:hypothetical protein